MKRREMGLDRDEETATSLEFRELYRRPGARYLGIAGLMGGISAIGFYAIDAIGGALSWHGGAQTLRLALAAFCFSIATFTRIRAAPLLHVCTLGCSAGAARSVWRLVAMCRSPAMAR